MHSKPKVLVIALEYYPIQNANTAITGKLVSHLCDRFDFVIAAQNIHNGPEKETVQGIPVVRAPFHAYSKRDKTDNNTASDLARMVYLKLVSKYKGDEIKRKNVYFFVRDIGKLVNMEEIYLIVSFSNPFESHYCASLLAEKHHIPYQKRAYPGNTVCDAWRMQTAAGGCEMSLFSLPLRYMHTPVECIHLGDLEQLARLMAAAVAEPCGEGFSC